MAVQTQQTGVHGETHRLLQSGQPSNREVPEPRQKKKKKKTESVHVCKFEIKVTVRGTTAASGLDGWGTEQSSD